MRLSLSEEAGQQSTDNLKWRHVDFLIQAIKNPHFWYGTGPVTKNVRRTRAYERCGSRKAALALNLTFADMLCRRVFRITHPLGCLYQENGTRPSAAVPTSNGIQSG
jgi:hypothetical protein